MVISISLPRSSSSIQLNGTLPTSAPTQNFENDIESETHEQIENSNLSDTLTDEDTDLPETIALVSDTTIPTPSPDSETNANTIVIDPTIYQILNDENTDYVNVFDQFGGSVS